MNFGLDCKKFYTGNTEMLKKVLMCSLYLLGAWKLRVLEEDWEEEEWDEEDWEEEEW